MRPDDIKKAAMGLPREPGIYIFRDAHNKPLYIGKALDLKNRVSHYRKTDDVRLQRMLDEAKKLDFIKTGSDIEALLLESQYIKKYNPPFNIMLRDDKKYFYVGFTDAKFPKLFLTHQPNSKYRNIEISKFIGPFTDGNAIKTTLRLLRRIFPYCTCKQTHNNYCLNYHINKCPGFCCLKKPTTNNSQPTTYRKNIKAIKDILSGKRKLLIKQFEKEMKKLGKNHKFEEALELQYKIAKLKRVFQNAQIIRDTKYETLDTETTKDSTNTLKQLANLMGMIRLPHRIEAYDIANIQGKHAVGAMVVFTDGEPNKNEYRKFKIINVPTCNVGTKTSQVKIGDTGMLKEILTRRFNHSEWPYPDLIIIDGGKAQLNAAISATTESLTSYGSRTSIITAALTKNDKHQGEKIFIQNKPSYAKASAGKKEAIALSKLPTEAKNLLLQIDSEAHRFAISYYRKLHQKKTLRS